MFEEEQALGAYLRGERQLRQIPLAEVAEATKIPLQSLELLERGDWEDLPAEIFVRGFVRSYARHVGIPDEDACKRFRTVIAHREALANPVGMDPDRPDEVVEVGGRRNIGLALVVIIVLILATITLSLFWRKGAGASTHSQNLEPTMGEVLSSPDRRV